MSLNLLKFVSRLEFLSQERRLALYPPFFLMRIKVLEISGNWDRARFKLPLNMVSKNMGGSMFGGYQAALSDPIAALACVKRYPGTDVWTRHHTVDFRHPGDSDLELRFEFPVALDVLIREELATKGRSTPTFEYGFYRQDGKMCTQVRSTVAIRPEGYLSDVGSCSG
ncbi:hypothetical protein MNBD_GAMMA25-745 [hydrothermal vent metagenome]|uniref:Thioesterase domain-containing protein n=1 Tax=hydrothermal vent metagenome TaxID=652676 RepID=A0A3B1B9M5_9ZZZZ